MREDNVVIHLEQDQLVTPARSALTRRGAAPSNPDHWLRQTQIEPLHKRGVAQPTISGQDLIHRGLGPDHHGAREASGHPTWMRRQLNTKATSRSGSNSTFGTMMTSPFLRVKGDSFTGLTPAGIIR